MSSRQYYAERAAVGLHKRKQKYGHKRTAAVDTGIFLMCLFPPAAIVFGLGKLAWDLAHTSNHDTY